MFLDFLCINRFIKGDDSKNSYLALKNVMKVVDFKAKGIKFTIQHVPLPYHFYSFKIHQGNYNPNQRSFTSKEEPQKQLLNHLSTTSLIIKINSLKKIS